MYFRSELCERARSLGVAGWALNRTDGSVEAVLEGPAEHVASLVAWCRRGPAGARVDEISVEREEPRGAQGFTVG